MQCRKSEQLMVGLLDLPGNAPQWEILNEHLSGCSRCRESLQLLRFSRQLLERPPAHAELSPYFIPQLMTSIRQSREEKELNWGLVWRFSRQLAALSAVILLLFIGTLFYQVAQVSPETSVVVDGIMEPWFSDRSVNDILLETDKPQREQVLEALLSSGGTNKR